MKIEVFYIVKGDDEGNVYKKTREKRKAGDLDDEIRLAEKNVEQGGNVRILGSVALMDKHDKAYTKGVSV